MSMTVEQERVPLKKDSHGVWRIGGTRVTLDTIVASFNEGVTAEEIVYRYPTLDLADVYAVLSYYLRHRQNVEEYLMQRRHLSEQVAQQNQQHLDSRGIRERLLARQAKTG